MEVYNPSTSQLSAYRKIMMQHGSGYDNDGYYIYSQRGEGIGSFFGGLIKSALPILGRSIKAGATLAKPYIKKGAADIVAAGSKHIADKLTGDITKSLSRPKKKRRRRI